MDLAILVLRRMHWILAFAAAASIAAYFASGSLPATYQSESIISTEKNGAAALGVNAYQVAAMLKSTDLALQFYQSDTKLRNLEQQRALEIISKRLKVTVGRPDKLVSLTTTGDTPQEAQAMNTFFLEKVFELSRPRGPHLDLLNKSIQPLNDALANSVLIRDLLTKAVASGRQISDSQAAIYADMMRSIPDLSTRLTELETIRTGLTSSDLVQKSTLPTKPTFPNKLQVVVLTAIAGVALGMLWILAHHYWRILWQSGLIQRTGATELRVTS